MYVGVYDRETANAWWIMVEFQHKKFLKLTFICSDL